MVHSSKTQLLYHSNILSQQGKTRLGPNIPSPVKKPFSQGVETAIEVDVSFPKQHLPWICHAIELIPQLVTFLNAIDLPAVKQWVMGSRYILGGLLEARVGSVVTCWPTLAFWQDTWNTVDALRSLLTSRICKRPHQSFGLPRMTLKDF